MASKLFKCSLHCMDWMAWFSTKLEHWSPYAFIRSSKGWSSVSYEKFSFWWLFGGVFSWKCLKRANLTYSANSLAPAGTSFKTLTIFLCSLSVFRPLPRFLCNSEKLHVASKWFFEFSWSHNLVWRLDQLLDPHADNFALFVFLLRRLQ